MWSYSVVKCIRHLMAQLLYCSAADAGVWGERLWWWLQPLHMTQQYCLAPWLPGFPPLAFPTTVSFLTPPQSDSPHSTAAFALGLLHNP